MNLYIWYAITAVMFFIHATFYIPGAIRDMKEAGKYKPGVSDKVLLCAAVIQGAVWPLWLCAYIVAAIWRKA